MNEFLPKDYELPVSEGQYYKFQKGANNFRILSSAIVGYEYWTNDNKPVRSKTLWETVPTNARLDEGHFKPKHFWAFLVYNYDAKKVQIMEITQKTIMGAIKALVSNPKWGSPTGYDITVTREGDGLETEYSVVPEPHSGMPITDIPKVRLEALYKGGDPFAKETLSDGSEMPSFD